MVRVESCVPIAGTSVRLTSSAPRIAPNVLAAYTEPTRRGRIVLGGRDGGAGQGKARAPQDGGRQNGPQAARHVELEVIPGAGGQHRIDRPVGQRVRDHVGGPRDSESEQKLAPAERQTGAVACPDGAKQHRPRAAADGEADEEDRQDDGENVNRGAQNHRHQARPDHLGAEGGGAGDRDGQIHRPVRGWLAGQHGRGRGGIGAESESMRAGVRAASR